ncbi:MAG: hypothetical protein ACLP4R_21145 [Solirubrobacteraceae bacterium]
MTAQASVFVTYLWHYVVARGIYDELMRPLLHGHVSTAAVVAAVIAVAFCLGRLSRRRA